MNKVTDQGITIDATVLQLMFDGNFLKQVDDGITLLDIMFTLINKCQQNKFSIADKAEDWLLLKSLNGCPELEKILVRDKNIFLLLTACLQTSYIHLTEETDPNFPRWETIKQWLFYCFTLSQNNLRHIYEPCQRHPLIFNTLIWLRFFSIIVLLRLG